MQRQHQGHPEGSGRNKTQPPLSQQRFLMSSGSRGPSQRGSAHCFDTDHVSSGAVVDRTLTHLRNETHRGAVPILARVVGTAPGGPGSAQSLIGLMGEQSAESGYKFSSRHFFGNSERACDLWPRFKEEQIVDTHSSFFSRNQVVHAVYGGVTGPWLRSIRG